MAYTPTEWQSGDIVTSEKLNKIENGIAGAGGGAGGGVLVATMDEATGALDKTWQEIYDAMNSSVLCVSRSKTENDAEGFTSIAFNIIQDVVLQEGSYSLHLSDGTPFIASTANDYPVMND